MTPKIGRGGRGAGLGHQKKRTNTLFLLSTGKGENGTGAGRARHKILATQLIARGRRPLAVVKLLRRKFHSRHVLTKEGS